MYWYFAVITLSAIGCVVLAPAVKRLAGAVGAVDLPAGDRKIHAQATPRLGGAAIFFPVLLVVCLAMRYFPPEDPLLDAWQLVALVSACAAVFLIGLYDDIRGCAPVAKLIVQVGAASVVYLSGIGIGRISTPFGGDLSVGVVAYPLTLLWIVGLSNGMNLLDGIDGLAAGVSAMGALTILVVALGQGSSEVVLIAAALLGSLLGFLVFNFPPASIFLGDCGALTVGFLLAVMPIVGNQKTATAVTLLVPIIALGIPIFDTTLAVIRRTVRGKHPFDPDRQHIHHRLLALGLTQRQVTLNLYAASALLTLLAIFMSNASRIGALMILLAVGAAGVVALRQIGADEFRELWGRFRHGERRRRPPRRRSILVRNTVPLLDRCETLDAVESLLEDVRKELEFEALRMRVSPIDLPVSSDAMSQPAPTLREAALGSDPVGDQGEAICSIRVAICCELPRSPGNRRNDACRFGVACHFATPDGPRECGRVVGELLACKPAWKGRRASEHDEDLLQELAKGLGRWITTHVCAAAVARPRILVAATDSASRARIHAALERAYEVISADDGVEAISQAHACLPDLILLDGTTLRMDGRAACRALRTDPRTARTPIIILANPGNVSDPTRDGGNGRGADGYLVTPFDGEALRSQVAKALRRGNGS